MPELSAIKTSQAGVFRTPPPSRNEIFTWNGIFSWVGERSLMREELRGASLALDVSVSEIIQNACLPVL